MTTTDSTTKLSALPGDLRALREAAASLCATIRDGLIHKISASEMMGRENQAIRDYAAAESRILSTVSALTAERDALRAALVGMVNTYTQLVDSGDAGFWDAETIPAVKAAHSALDRAARSPEETP